MNEPLQDGLAEERRAAECGGGLRGGGAGFVCLAVSEGEGEVDSGS